MSGRRGPKGKSHIRPEPRVGGKGASLLPPSLANALLQDNPISCRGRYGRKATPSLGSAGSWGAKHTEEGPSHPNHCRGPLSPRNRATPLCQSSLPAPCCAQPRLSTSCTLKGMGEPRLCGAPFMVQSESTSGELSRATLLSAPTTVGSTRGQGSVQGHRSQHPSQEGTHSHTTMGRCSSQCLPPLQANATRQDVPTSHVGTWGQTAFPLLGNAGSQGGGAHRGGSITLKLPQATTAS